MRYTCLCIDESSTSTASMLNDMSGIQEREKQNHQPKFSTKLYILSPNKHK